MIRKLTWAIIALPTFVLFLLSNITAMAQSTTMPPVKIDDGDRKDTGQPIPATDAQMKDKSTSPSGAKTAPPSPSEGNTGGSPGTDQKKNPAGETGGSSGY